MQEPIADAALESDPASNKPVPYRTILKNPNVRILASSRAAGRVAQSTLNYGAMVHLSQTGASQFGVSLVASSSYLAPLLFGVQGGAVADSLSKRIALALGFAAQSTLCILTPLFFGTSVGSLHETDPDNR